MAPDFKLIWISKADATERQPMGWYYKIAPPPGLCGPFKSASKAREDFTDTYDRENGSNRCACGQRIDEDKEYCSKCEPDFTCKECGADTSAGHYSICSLSER